MVKMRGYQESMSQRKAPLIDSRLIATVEEFLALMILSSFL
jgi:hypothetical protein